MKDLANPSDNYQALFFNSSIDNMSTLAPPFNPGTASGGEIADAMDILDPFNPSASGNVVTCVAKNASAETELRSAANAFPATMAGKGHSGWTSNDDGVTYHFHKN